jgi:hypothetical protein
MSSNLARTRDKFKRAELAHALFAQARLVFNPTCRERKLGHKMRRQIRKCALSKGNPTILGQVHHFLTSQLSLYLFNDYVPNMFNLVGGPQ